MTRVAVVTGACGGIGKAICSRFRAEGWQVVGVGRTPPGPSQELDRFEQVDLTDSADIADLFGRLSDLGSLDALVNNAALQINKPLIETTDEEWQRVFDTNVRAAFQLIREGHALLAASRGSIVNVSSVHAIATSPNVAAYAITKGTLVSLTRTTALELAADGIRCNAVLPGAIDTPMLTDGLGRRPHPDGAEGNRCDLIERTPLQFIASPEQISPSVVHLADNEQSPYITGQTLVIDGGATLRLGTE